MARPELSVQLYSVRELLAADPAGTLTALADAGFTAVEPFGLDSWAGRLADPLTTAGLHAPTAHVSLVGVDIAPAIRAARNLGVGTLIEPAVRENRWTSRESVAAIADELNRSAARAADEGLSVGYHNHWWELESRIDGAHALDVFAGLLDDRVVLELDAYWAAVGGADPVALVERLGERVAALHVKDGPVTREPRDQLPAGQGRMPWRELFGAAPDARLVVEFDEYAGDLLEGIAVARDWVVAEGAAR